MPDVCEFAAPMMENTLTEAVMLKVRETLNKADRRRIRAHGPQYIHAKEFNQAVRESKIVRRDDAVVIPTPEARVPRNRRDDLLDISVGNHPTDSDRAVLEPNA